MDAWLEFAPGEPSKRVCVYVNASKVPQAYARAILRSSCASVGHNREGKMVGCTIYNVRIGRQSEAYVKGRRLEK